MEECDEDVDFLLALAEEAVTTSHHSRFASTKLPPAVAAPSSSAHAPQPLSALNTNTLHNIHASNNRWPKPQQQQQQQQQPQPPSSFSALLHHAADPPASATHTLHRPNKGSINGVNNILLTHANRGLSSLQSRHPPHHPSCTSSLMGPPPPPRPQSNAGSAAAGGYIEICSGLKVSNPLVGSLVVKVSTIPSIRSTRSRLFHCSADLIPSPFNRSGSTDVEEKNTASQSYLT
jgi:hypothetical protein